MFHVKQTRVVYLTILIKTRCPILIRSKGAFPMRKKLEIILYIICLLLCTTLIILFILGGNLIFAAVFVVIFLLNVANLVLRLKRYKKDELR